MAPPKKKLPIASIDEISSKEMKNEWNLALGYRFCPTDAELIVGYLAKKIKNLPLPSDIPITDVSLYHHTPDQIAETHDCRGQNEWYFFTERKKKYTSTEKRLKVDRALKTGDGYWKASLNASDVIYEGSIVGAKRRLVFYELKTGAKRKREKSEGAVDQEEPTAREEGKKTDWSLIEYYIHAPDTSIVYPSVCKLYKTKIYQNGDLSEKKSDNIPNLDLTLSVSAMPQQDIPDS